MDRMLEWPGCRNVRDLGGLPVVGGARTRRGALVRADSLAQLTREGWQAVIDHGVRTVIDLRNDFEMGADAWPRPQMLTTVRLPLDGLEHAEFWAPYWNTWRVGTPIYYRPHLEHLPERSLAVLRAIAQAPPGGVAFHCGIGRDRTGLVALLVLALVGVEPEHIGDDYALSDGRVPEEAISGAECLAREGTTARELVVALAGDACGLLARAGLGDEDRQALRRRLVG